jgi:hypothetical protein
MSKTQALCFILLLGLSTAFPSIAQQNDPLKEQIFREIQTSLDRARREEISLLAPANYQRAYEAYQKSLDRFRRGDKLKNIRQDLDQATKFLKAAEESAKLSRVALESVLTCRRQVLNDQFNNLAPAEYAEADLLFQEIAQSAEKGDIRSAREKIPELEKQYRKTVITAYQKTIFKNAEKNLNSRKRDIKDSDYKTAGSRLDQVAMAVKEAEKKPFVVADFAAEINAKIVDALDAIYPEFYRHLPDTLQLGAFTLYVLSYANHGTYDFDKNIATHLTGEAEVAFHCGLFTLYPMPWGSGTIVQKFKVVQMVQNPEYEMTLAEAKKLDAKIILGQELSLPLQAKSSAKADILDAKNKFFGQITPATSASRGRIRLRFTDVSIAPNPRDTFATITAGQAFYPTQPPDPAQPAEIHTAGFTIRVDSLSLTPATATATAALVLPPSLVDASGCHPAVLNLGQVSITADCQLYKELPDSAYGPFIIDQTGMIVQGQAYVVDLSSTQSPTGLGLSNNWQGVILRSGSTNAAPSGSVTSNVGYLQASYQFSNAKITATGLAARFNSTAAFEFSTMQPYGYTLHLGPGYLDIDSSRVQAGQFGNGAIRLPAKAVCKGSIGVPLQASFTTMTVQKDLDLAAPVTLNEKLSWGELSRSGEELISYAAVPNAGSPNFQFFYLCGRPNVSYLPKSAADFIIHWGMDPIAKAEEKQIAGVTLLAFKEFEVYTPDIPGAAPKKITFKEGGGATFVSSWLNIDYGGVNGTLIIMPQDNSHLQAGDPAADYYACKTPFDASLQCEGQKKEKCLFIQFSSSAVFDSEFNGILDIEGPCKIKLPFKDLELTSTAHMVGGDIDLSGGPVTLDYWGVQLVSTSSTDPAGVLCVKTGQVIFTQAGIQEKRHFTIPFKLYWGEMLADGNIGELFFDYNTANQKFDGFNFTPKYLALSNYDSTKTGYMQICGDNHFNFFGANYLNIQDGKYTGADDLGVYGERSIAVLNSSVDGCQASNLKIRKAWSSLGVFDYTIKYDANDQDGFIGEGSTDLPDHFNTELRSSIQMDSVQIAASLSIDSGVNYILADRDFGTAAELWGCVTITGNTLSCITLGFTLEATSQSAFGIWGGEGAMIEVQEVIKPTFTSFAAAGKMYVDFALGGGTVGLDGAILLTMDTAAKKVTGDLQGNLDFTSLFAGLKAEGHVNWSLSPTTQYLQGRAAISVFARKFSGGASGGIFLGNNVPNNECWVLLDPNNRYSIAMDKLPAFVSGVYGFGSIDLSLNFGIFSGGIGIYAGVGAFVNLISVVPHAGVPLPYVLANIGVSLNGEILWGLVSASAWVNMQMSLGVPTYFQGTAGLEGCVLWVVCGSVDVTVRLSDDGFEIY